MGDQVQRPKLGDYRLANHRGHLTHTFRLANPAAFDIKSTVLNGLRDKQYDGTENMSLHEHFRFVETCEFCVPPATVTDSQKKVRLFPFTLTRKAKDWLLTIPSGTIQTWDELELKFLEKYFCMSKYWDKKMEIQNFNPGDTESLYMMLGKILLWCWRGAQTMNSPKNNISKSSPRAWHTTLECS